jgi:hypothetical protein
VQAEELLEDLSDQNGGRFTKNREKFRRMRVEEATKRPIENSTS